MYSVKQRCSFCHFTICYNDWVPFNMCLLELCVANKCYPCHDKTMDDIYNEQDTLSLQKHDVSLCRIVDFSSHDFFYLGFVS